MADDRPWPGQLDGPLLDGRTALITGAGSVNGIGRATARLFARHGARVAVSDIDADGAQAVADEIGPGHLGLTCDVTDRESCEHATNAALSAFGSVDILINNVGFTKGTRIMDVEGAEFDLLHAINVRSMMFMSQAAIPSMRRRRSGTIVCLASVAGQRGGGLYGSSHYAASKAGVIGLGKALARELAADGIRVNIVSPSLIKTDGSPGDSEEVRGRFEKDVPMVRSGTVWEVAGAILFAASDLSGYMTGATIDVNGGFYMR